VYYRKPTEGRVARFYAYAGRTYLGCCGDPLVSSGGLGGRGAKILEKALEDESIYQQAKKEELRKTISTPTIEQILLVSSKFVSKSDKEEFEKKIRELYKR